MVSVRLPDLGDFADVEIIEVLVSPGDVVAVEDGLVTLETDKASMDVPASHAGRIVSVEVAVGGTVSTGDVVAIVEAEASESADPDAGPLPETWGAQTEVVAEVFSSVMAGSWGRGSVWSSLSETGSSLGSVPITETIESKLYAAG